MTGISIEQAMLRARKDHESGRLREAEILYRQVLAQEPRHQEALHRLGILAAQAGRPDVAVGLLEQVVAMNPGHAEARSNLGYALSSNGRTEEAIASFREAVRLKPDFADGYNNLGTALRTNGQIEEAITVFRRALSLRPEVANSHYNLANALHAKGESNGAIHCYRQAILLKPDYSEAHNNLGNALQAIEEFEEAVAAYREALRLDPNYTFAHYNLGNALRALGLLDLALDHYRKAVDLAPDRAELRSTFLLTICYHPDYDSQRILSANREWNLRHAEPLAPKDLSYGNEPSATRRLRIGYVSPDFRDHPVGRNLLPLLREHDRQEVEVFCYSGVLKPDAVTSRFCSLAGAWRDIAGLRDEAAVELIRRDHIDILVDLALHTEGNRLLVFARKPVPIQVTFGGYPGGTGLDAMQYRLTDPWLDPPGVSDPDYREESIRLPHSFWCYDEEGMTLGLPAFPSVGSLPATKSGIITFGSLNNFSKVNAEVLRLWAQVLKATSGSRLLVLVPNAAQHRFTSNLELFGIDPARVEFAGRQSRDGYLQLFNRIDIGLDTFPYNGHTTTLDALWMGVPVVTLVGKTVVGRAGLSQLSNLGLTELIAHSTGEYVRIASGLAADVERLAALRSGLRSRMRQSPLTDAAGFARGIEAAYRNMWKQWCGRICNEHTPSSPSSSTGVHGIH